MFLSAQSLTLLLLWRLANFYRLKKNLPQLLTSERLFNARALSVFLLHNPCEHSIISLVVSKRKLFLEAFVGDNLGDGS